jgi:hypothetical protein
VPDPQRTSNCAGDGDRDASFCALVHKGQIGCGLAEPIEDAPLKMASRLW